MLRIRKEIVELADFQYKTKPFDHQREDFELTRDETSWAYLWEMGLGKTKITCDVAAWNYANGRIDFMLVIAPNGVHTNWIADEIDAHMPDWTNYKMAEWSGSGMKADQKKQVDDLFVGWKQSPRPLRILCMNIEAFGIAQTYYKQKAGKMARAILNAFKVMMVVDESTLIKNFVNRTERIVGLGKHAEMRRILDGTPVTTGPLNLYYPFKFLNGGGMQPGGQGTFLLGPYSTNMESFKGQYAEYEEVELKQPRRGKGGKIIQTHYPNLVGYRNLEELSDFLAKCSSRRLKRDCLDLPPKLYEKIPVELHKEQAKRYRKVIDEGVLELKAMGSEVTMANVLVMWLRAQQVVGGFVPTENPEDSLSECILDDYNDLPRVQQFREHMERAQSGKVIIYCRFLAEVRMWKEIYGNAAVTYIGVQHYKGGKAERLADKERFQGTRDNDFKDHDPSCQFLIMNKAGCRGLTLTQATYFFYYSNEFSLDLRLQSEDRPHRIGQNNPVTYFDGIAKGTIDERLVQGYRDNKQIADIITKDDPQTWV